MIQPDEIKMSNLALPRTCKPPCFSLNDRAASRRASNIIKKHIKTTNWGPLLMQTTNDGKIAKCCLRAQNAVWQNVSKCFCGALFLPRIWKGERVRRRFPHPPP